MADEKTKSAVAKTVEAVTSLQARAKSGEKLETADLAGVFAEIDLSKTMKDLDTIMTLPALIGNAFEAIKLLRGENAVLKVRLDELEKQIGEMKDRIADLRTAEINRSREKK